MEHNIKLTATEVVTIITALETAIDFQKDLLPDYKARVMIDSYETLRDHLESWIHPKQ